MRGRSLGLALGAMVAVSAPALAADPGAAAGKRLAVVLKAPGTANPFWAAVASGAQGAGREWSVDVAVSAPPTESDVAAQIALVDDAIARGVAGIALAPADPDALAPSVEAAIGAGIAVVFLDTWGTNEGVTLIGSDNAAGAALQASHLCQQVAAGTPVAVLQGLVTQSTGLARATGARDGLIACGLDVAAEVPGAWDAGVARTATEVLLADHPDLAGIVAGNDLMALGAVEAVRAHGRLAQVTIVGFDGTPAAIAAIVAGDLEATVAQAPSMMGTRAVESLVGLINGASLPSFLDTGVTLVTAANAMDPR